MLEAPRGLDLKTKGCGETTLTTSIITEAATPLQEQGRCPIPPPPEKGTSERLLPMQNVVVYPRPLGATLQILANLLTDKGQFEPAELLAIICKLDILRLEDLPLGKSALTRVLSSLKSLETKGFSGAFESLQNNSETNLGVSCLEKEMGCKDPKQTDLNEDLELILPKGVEEIAEKVGLDKDFVRHVWFAESATERLTFRLRIKKNIDAFVHRCENGWVRKPMHFFRAMVERGFPVNKTSPEEIARHKAEKEAEKALVAAKQSDLVRMEQRKQEDLQEVSSHPTELDENTKQVMRKYYSQHKKLSEGFMFTLKLLGFEKNWRDVLGLPPVEAAVGA